MHIRKYSFTFILFFPQQAEEHLDMKALVLETLHRCCQTLPANHVKNRQHPENSFYDLFCYSPLKMLQTERLVKEYLMHILFSSLPNSSACWEFWQENLPRSLLKWQKRGKDPHVFVCFGYLICLMAIEGWAFQWHSAWKLQGNVKQKLNSSWNFRWWDCDWGLRAPSFLFPHTMLKLLWMWSVWVEGWSHYFWPHPRVCLCHTETPLVGWCVLTRVCTI